MCLSFFFLSCICKNTFLDKILKKKFFSRYCFSINFSPIYFFNFLKLGIECFHSNFFFLSGEFLFKKKKTFIILNKIIDFFIDKNLKFKKNLTFYAKKKKISNAFFNKYEDKKLSLSIGKVLSPKKKIFFKILAQKELVFMNTY